MHIGVVSLMLLLAVGTANADSPQSIPDGRRGQPGESLETQMQPDGNLRFTIWTTGGGGHVCRLNAVAEPSVSGAFTYREAASQCVLKLSVEGENLFTDDVGDYCRPVYCGYRNDFGRRGWSLRDPKPLTSEIRADW